jgi:hypothetical protein
MDKLLVTIDRNLPCWDVELVKIRETALTDILARLQQQYGSQEDWELEAASFLDTIEGEAWSKLVSPQPNASNKPLILPSVRSV